MNDYRALIESYDRKFKKSLVHLRYSFDKIIAYPTSPAHMTEAQLESWEGFASRFARSADIFLSRLLRAAIMHEDPGFEGSLRDLVDYGEKLGLLADAGKWMEIRALRNISAHDYTEEDLEVFFQKIMRLTPHILDGAGVFDASFNG